MKKIILVCLCIAMSFIKAGAQCVCEQDRCECKRSSSVYYPFFVNGQELRFEGKNATIAAAHLLQAKETYFMNIDRANGKTVEVYKLKNKGEYAVLVGGVCYRYRDNTTVLCRLNQLNVRDQLFCDNSREGFILGYDQTGRVVLAIFKD